MPRKRIRITTTPELRKQKRGGYSVRFRIPAHDGEPERKSPWRKYPDAKTKGLALQEAETYRQELEDEINDYSLKKDITFGQYARRWHEDRQDSGELNGDFSGTILQDLQDIAPRPAEAISCVFFCLFFCLFFRLSFCISFCLSFCLSGCHSADSPLRETRAARNVGETCFTMPRPAPTRQKKARFLVRNAENRLVLSPLLTKNS